MKQDLHRTIIRNILKSAKGTIFTACFVKKDGSERTMNCRLGVTKGLVDPKNPQYPTSAHLPEYIVVWDLHAPCRHCDGTGTVIKSKVESEIGHACPKCKGRGKGGYRHINFDTLKWVKVGGIVLKASADVVVPSC